ncbi:MAG: PepSY domain-containing protein [Chloroflexota bacterium]
MTKKKTAKYLYGVMWRWHFYMGLFIAPILIIVSITGSLYVFKDEIEPYIDSELLFVDSPVTAETIAHSQAVAAAEMAYPAYTARSLFIDRDPERTWNVRMENAEEEYTTAYVNQYSGELQGERAYNEGFFGVVLRIHRQLFADTLGRIIVETSTAWGIISVITGVFLWWPRAKDKIHGVWRMRLRKTRKIFWRDLHSVPAIYIAIFAVLIMFTGMLFSFTGQYTILGMGLALGQLPEIYTNPPKSAVVENADTIGLDAAVATFDEAYGIAHFNAVIPSTEDGTYSFTTNLDKNFSQARLFYVDQYSGEVLAQVGWADLTGFTKAILYFYPIHTGGIYGMPTKILAFLTCWIIALMSVSGVVMWWQRKPAGVILGAPHRPKNALVPRVVTVLTIIFGIILPTVGISLLVILLGGLIGRLIQRLRRPAVQLASEVSAGD